MANASPKRQSKRKLVATVANDSDSVNGKRASESNEEDMVEPLCTSMKNLTSTADLSISHESMVSDGALCQPNNYEHQMKTPNEMAKPLENGKGHVARGISSKKSLIFDSGMTPDAKDTSVSSARSSDLDGSDPPKAKASLSFTETAIPTRSFYGKTSEPTIVVAKPKVEWIFNQQFQSKVAKKSSDARMKQKLRARQLAKRMKAPSLWRFSGKMKFNKFKGKGRSKATNISKSSGSSKQNTSISSSGHDTSTQQIHEADQTNSIYTSNIEQNLRLQQILKEQQQAMNLPRAINWNGGEGASGSAQFTDSESESDNEETENTDPQENLVPGPEEQSKRKFFKSSSNTSAKYRVMGRISATVKRGGDLKLQSMPKRKKHRPNKGSYIRFDCVDYREIFI